MRVRSLESRILGARPSESMSPGLALLNGDILSAGKSVTAIRGADVVVCTLNLKAGHRYLILGGATSSISESNSCMSVFLSVQSGSASEWIDSGATKTWMSNGGGCAAWAYALCAKDSVIALKCYGYSDSTYNYIGRLLAIQLQ